jgi:hypothetical protein
MVIVPYGFDADDGDLRPIDPAVGEGRARAMPWRQHEAQATSQSEGEVASKVVL